MLLIGSLVAVPAESPSGDQDPALTRLIEALDVYLDAFDAEDADAMATTRDEVREAMPEVGTAAEVASSNDPELVLQYATAMAILAESDADRDGAIVLFRRVLELAPGSDDYAARIFGRFSRFLDERQAIPFFEWVHHQGVGSAESHRWLGVAYQDAGNFERARDELAKSVEMDDGKAFALASLVQVCEKLGDREAVDRYRARIIEIYEAGTDEEMGEYTSFIRDTFEIEGREFITVEFLEPIEFAIQYNWFGIIPAEGSRANRVTYSTSVKTNAGIQPNGDPRPDRLIYWVDSYEADGSQALIGMEDEPLPYEEFKRRAVAHFEHMIRSGKMSRDDPSEDWMP